MQQLHQLALPLLFGTEDRAAPTGAAHLGPGLPAWESFPTRDRQLLLHALVQTVRRRVPSGATSPTSRPPKRSRSDDDPATS